MAKGEVESIRDDMDDFNQDLGLRFAKIVRKVQWISTSTLFLINLK